MIFNKSIFNIIKKRHSTRKYKNKIIEINLKTELKSSFNDANKNLPFGNKINLKLVDKKELSAEIYNNKKFSDVRTFIACKVKNNSRNLEDIGYAVEKLVLKATETNLSSCWIGGFFNKKIFADIMDLKKDEILPCLIALGYSKFDIKSLIRNLIYFMKKRKPWKELFFNNDINHSLILDKTDKYLKALEMVRLAPSASNKQPWRIIKKDNYYHFYIMRSKAYKEFIKKLNVDIQRIDMGIAMTHFELACNELNLKGSWKVLKHSEFKINDEFEYIISWEILN